MGNEKQIAVLPFEHSALLRFEHGTRPSVEEIEAAGFKHHFQTFGKGIATMFFGRYVLHQAISGEGSMETRYLVLVPRRSTHRFSACRESCISRDHAWHQRSTASV